MPPSIPGLVGPGSQPESQDGSSLDYMEMPRDMAVFELPVAPEPEDTIGMDEGKALLNQIASDLAAHKITDPTIIYDLNILKPEDLGLINQLLGEGEVSIVCAGHLQAQESVLAGVWRVIESHDQAQGLKDRIELGAFPSIIYAETFRHAQNNVSLDTDFPDGIINAPSVLAEIQDKVAHYKQGDPTHAINLTLLPQSEEDLNYLAAKLGIGNTIILSRGYGNCRVSSTMTKNVWWVQYFNSQDATILNSIEIIDLPEVVKAAQEDIEDSAERLSEIMEIYA